MARCSCGRRDRCQDKGLELLLVRLLRCLEWCVLLLWEPMRLLARFELPPRPLHRLTHPHASAPPLADFSAT